MYYLKVKYIMETLKNNSEVIVDNPVDEDTDIVSILFIFDQSASMISLGSEPTESMGAFYDNQKKTGKKFLSTLATFNSTVNFIHKNINGDEIEIKNSDFCPQGMTALYDAICESINYQKTVKTNNVICVILTDGLENSSNKYNSHDVKKLIEEMENDHKWVFIYLGANQDSFAVSRSLGINPRFSANYEYSPCGLNEIMRGVSDTVSRCVSNSIKFEDFVPEIVSKPSSKINDISNTHLQQPLSPTLSPTLPSSYLVQRY